MARLPSANYFDVFVMDVVSLDVQKRDKSVKAKELLGTNLIPAEYYGKGVENASFQMDYQTFRRAFRKAGANTIVELNIDGGETLSVLVHDVQYHPVTDNIKHVDFINVRMGEKLKTTVPLEFVGIAPAVKEQGGVLAPHLHEVEVECLPRDLIHSIEVNIEGLVDFIDSIKVSDLKVPAVIEILNDPDELVVTTVPPREEEAELPVVDEAKEAAVENAAAETTEEGGE